MCFTSFYDVHREYEARIAELKEQFGQEQADKANLQLELERLQREWDDQLQVIHSQVWQILTRVITTSSCVEMLHVHVYKLRHHLHTQCINVHVHSESKVLPVACGLYMYMYVYLLSSRAHTCT